MEDAGQSRCVRGWRMEAIRWDNGDCVGDNVSILEWVIGECAVSGVGSNKGGG